MIHRWVWRLYSSRYLCSINHNLTLMYRATSMHGPGRIPHLRWEQCPHVTCWAGVNCCSALRCGASVVATTGMALNAVRVAAAASLRMSGTHSASARFKIYSSVSCTPLPQTHKIAVPFSLACMLLNFHTEITCRTLLQFCRS